MYGIPERINRRFAAGAWLKPIGIPRQVVTDSYQLLHKLTSKPREHIHHQHTAIHQLLQLLFPLVMLPEFLFCFSCTGNVGVINQGFDWTSQMR